jgi:hypothetical protein
MSVKRVKYQARKKDYAEWFFFFFFLLFLYVLKTKRHFLEAAFRSETQTLKKSSLVLVL